MRRLRGAALLVVVDLLEIRVDDLVAAAARTARGWSAGGRTAVATAGLLRLLRLVERLADFHRGLCQGLGLGLDLPGVVGAESVLQCLDRLLHGVAIGFSDLVSRFAQGPFGRVDQS